MRHARLRLCLSSSPESCVHGVYTNIHTACMECLSGADTTNTPHLVATREHSMGQTLIENMTVMTRVIADTTQMVKSMCAVNRAISFDD